MKYIFFDTESLSYLIGHTHLHNEGATFNKAEATVYDSENADDAEEIDNCMNYCSDFIEWEIVDV